MRRTFISPAKNINILVTLKTYDVTEDNLITLSVSTENMSVPCGTKSTVSTDSYLGFNSQFPNGSTCRTPEDIQRISNF